jgi:hypothetical protein
MSTEELNETYKYHCLNPSDINALLPTLEKYSRECSSILEIGVRSMVSTWAFLHGLANNNKSDPKIYTGLDLELPPPQQIELAKRLCDSNNIQFNFCKANDIYVSIKSPVDMVFIDSLHTYNHLTFELEKFCPYASKYICFHDMDDPWGFRDEYYGGNYTEYPRYFTADLNKHGLLKALQDFLARHKEWELVEHLTYSHGFAAIRRKPESCLVIN